ncbi:RNA-directed DNA polymerase, eukaryota, reverse transcriptase zinc-binding domain protein [Tanacetum coccineum]|uniref:RNA-directed DNA polymerase, eukaryota, reverse transcriptase zinc-binding domain protein n=1 Tax=Tanacetum coccineum TaxID=301880 RepID=A0ABQ4YRS4_9ASTR
MKFLTWVYIMGHRRSDVDEVQKISTSIFVTNFPDQFYAKDLWKVCNQYGNVVDAFIPNRRSKSVATKVQSNAFKKLKMKGDECLQNIHDEKVAYEVKKTCSLSNSKNDKEESICSWHFKKAEVLCSGGSMLQLMDDLVKMNFMSLNIQGLAQKAKKIGLRSYVLTTSSSFGEWVPNGKKLVIISVYASQKLICKQAERYGSIFNLQGADAFNSFILTAGLEEIIAKILENRLVVVLRDIVNEFQSAFVANRRIPDGPFILNELFHWCKKNKKQTMIFKVDFEKAYDSVRWDYLDDVLKKIGFGDKWCVWIQICLRSSRGSVIVNGSPTREF